MIGYTSLHIIKQTKLYALLICLTLSLLFTYHHFLEEVSDFVNGAALLGFLIFLMDHGLDINRWLCTSLGCQLSSLLLCKLALWILHFDEFCS